MEHSTKGRPKIAIVDANTLAALGLKQILQNVIPIMTVDTFGSFAELVANQPDTYMHYFVSMNIVLQERPFRTWKRTAPPSHSQSPTTKNPLRPRDRGHVAHRTGLY